MKIERTSNGISFNGKYGGVTLQAFHPGYMFTPIEWTIERDAGYLTTTFTLLNCQVLLEVVIDRAKQSRWEASLKQSEQEFEDGDYYFFIHNKNKLLSEFAEYMEEHPELRFWQALSAWTGKDITVGGEDPFYWEEKIVKRN